MIGRRASLWLLAILAWIAATSGAFAHASLVAADPPDGTVLAKAPTTVSLDFSEPVSPLVARLVHPDGRSEIVHLDLGRSTHLTIALPQGVGRGSHVLSWRVVSEDGHPVAGASVFSVGEASTAAVMPAAEAGVRPALWFARLLVFAGFGFGVGGIVFSAWIGGPTGTARVAIALGSAGLAASVGLQGLDVLGAPFSEMTAPETWRAGLTATSYGWTVLLAALAFLSASAGKRRPIALLSLGLGAAAVAATGHAVTAPPQALTRPAVFLHAGALITWTGALPPLFLLLRRADDSAMAALRNFSEIAPFGIAILFGSGVGLAVVQLGGVGALVSTAYGNVLLVKSGLVAAVLLVALHNRIRLTGPTLLADVSAARRLRRSIAAETLLLAVVLGIAGLWRFTPPPRIEGAARLLASPAETLLQEGPFSAILTVSPGTAGPVTLYLTSLTRDGARFTPQGASVEIVKPSFGIGPFRRDAVADGEDGFQAGAAVLPIGGYWVVSVDVLVSDFETVRMKGLVEIREKPPSS